jgi:hypothetical protein
MDPPVDASGPVPMNTARSDRVLDLANLQADILLMLPLPQSSLASMVRVCKRYHQILTPRLYQLVRCKSTVDERRNALAQRYKPHVLMRTLLRYPILATSVRELLLDKSIWNGRIGPLRCHGGEMDSGS